MKTPVPESLFLIKLQASASDYSHLKRHSSLFDRLNVEEVERTET